MNEVPGQAPGGAAHETGTCPHREHVVLGMLAGLGAFFMFTCMNAFAKLLAEQHSVFEIAFYRNLIALLPFLVLIFGFGRRDLLVVHSQPRKVGGRAVLGTLTLAMTFTSYSLMPMADTTAFLFSASLFVPVLAVLFLGEPVGPWRWSAVAIGFAGVLVMLRPSGDLYLLGAGVALVTALMQAVLQIILRQIGRTERPETVSFYFFLIGTVLMALPLPFVAVRPTAAELPLLAGVGLTGAAAQWLLSTAFRHAPAVVVTVFNYSGIVWATLLGWLIWNDWPLPRVFAGAAIVIVSNLLIIWRESRRQAVTGARAVARL